MIMCLLRLFKIFSKAWKRNETGVDHSGLIFFLGFLAGTQIAVIKLNLEPEIMNRASSQHSDSRGSAQAKLLLKIENMQNRSTTWLSSEKQGTRILCWIMTTAKYHTTRAFHVKTTWGKHCDVLLFMSDGDDNQLPAVNLKVDGSYSLLWGKTVAAFKYLHDKYANDYDWVVKADDDTFVCVENLRKMLLSHKPADKKFWGYGLFLSANEKRPYPSGGAGYILSKSSVQAFVEYHEKGDHNGSPCPPKSFGNAEDYNFGRCMDYLGVKFIDSRDNKGRHTIFPVPLDGGGMFPGTLKSTLWSWVIDRSFRPAVNTARDTFSPKHISQHYVNSSVMYSTHYLLYDIKHPVPVEHIIRMDQDTSSANISKYPVNYSIIVG